jgi:hypothetical protein
VIEAVSPMALEVSFGIQHELQSRLDEADALRRKAVDRAQYDVDLARQRFMRVDPNNRLVADSLEADWNHKLRLLNEAQARYRQQHDADCVVLGDEQRARILALANDVPRLGACPGDEESAGVNRSHRSPKGNRQMRRLLNQAANAAVKTKGSIFEVVYRRLVPRLGHAQRLARLPIGSVG